MTKTRTLHKMTKSIQYAMRVIINKKKHHALKKTTKSETCIVAMCNMTDTDGCKMILSEKNGII
jgi:hypothetical protein